jgi:glycosyltransferase involved in cell wall biosynthesis
MRIAMISTSCISVPPRSYGGTELVIHELVEGLAARGHDVTLFATGDSVTAAELRHLYAEPQWPPNQLAEVNHASWAINAVIADGGFDLIHAHSTVALPLARMIPGIPLVYTIHHAREDSFSKHYESFPDTFYIGISRNQMQLETPLPRTEVIYHGLEPGRFECFDQPEKHVCFLARFSEIKGPHIAMDVAEMAGVPIKIAGEIHDVDQEFGAREVLPRLEKPHVEFMGCLGPEGKIPLLASSRALLAPIQWEEPFGLFMIEAMLSGCPVVAFPRGSVRELVEPGVTGFIAESPEEMAAIIRPGGPVDRFDRQACREKAIERFSRERMVADHEAAYTRVVLQSARRGPCNTNLQAV